MRLEGDRRLFGSRGRFGSSRLLHGLDRRRSLLGKWNWRERRWRRLGARGPRRIGRW